MDITCLNILGTQYFLIGVLDGYSRAMLHDEIRCSMTTTDVENVLERAHAARPAGTPPPRLVTGNGSQFVSAQFTQYLRTIGLAHSRTRVGHPQSNGKYERWNQTAKVECVRCMALGGRADPDALGEAQQVFGRYVDYHNRARPHSALQYLTPADYLRGPARVAACLAVRATTYRNAAIARRVYWSELAREKWTPNCPSISLGHGGVRWQASEHGRPTALSSSRKRSGACTNVGAWGSASRRLPASWRCARTACASGSARRA